MHKWIISVAALLCAGLISCTGANPAAGPVAKVMAAETGTNSQALSWRFIGLNALREKTNLVVFHEVTALKEFEGFRSGLAERLAATLAEKASGASNAELAKLLRAIAEDLISYPSIFEQQGAGASNACTLAVELPANRHDAWKANWDSILKMVKIPEAKLSREGNWTLVSNGSTKSVMDRTRGRATDVLEFTGDGAFLKNFLPNTNPQKVTLRVTSQGKSLRTEGKATFASDLNIKLSPWQIPTKTIREPLFGFTAAQGFVKDRLTGWGPFKDSPAPEQVFVWNDGRTPWSLYAAAKVPDPAGTVKKFVTGIDLKEAAKSFTGSLVFDTNSSKLMLTKESLPIVAPFFGPATESDKEFLWAGLMPMSISGDPMPPELARELTSRTNLIYYDWEITSMRQKQFPPIAQVYSMATGVGFSSYNYPAQKWLDAAEKLGNAVTEVALTGARELTLVRASDVGLSALELFQLSKWIGGPQAISKSVPVPLPK